MFYPAARSAITVNPLINEVTVEHVSAKELISQIKLMGVGDDLFDAGVKMLRGTSTTTSRQSAPRCFPRYARSSSTRLKCAAGSKCASRS